MRTNRIVAYSIMLLLVLYLDPYSRGYTGGDVRYDPIRWQVLIGGVQAAFLVGVAILAWNARRSWARLLGSVEGTVFLVTNMIYLLRDGAMRLTMGYAEPAWPLLVGLVLRAILLSELWRRSEAAEAHASRPTG